MNDACWRYDRGRALDAGIFSSGQSAVKGLDYLCKRRVPEKRSKRKPGLTYGQSNLKFKDR